MYRGDRVGVGPEVPWDESLGRKEPGKRRMKEGAWDQAALRLLPKLQRFLRILIRVPTRCLAKLAQIILNFTQSHTTHNEACWRSKLLSFRVKFHCAERVSGSHEFLIKEEKRLHCCQPDLGTLVTFSSAHSINPNKSGLPASTETLHTGRGLALQAVLRHQALHSLASS